MLASLANLELVGYEVVDARNGLQAIECVRQQPFDLVITDMRMPGINGLDTFREIRKIRPGTDVVTVASLQRSHFAHSMYLAAYRCTAAPDQRTPGAPGRSGAHPRGRSGCPGPQLRGSVSRSGSRSEPSISTRTSDG